MRVMLKVSIPLEEGNRMTREGKLVETIQAILEVQKPDTAYSAKTMVKEPHSSSCR